MPGRKGRKSGTKRKAQRPTSASCHRPPAAVISLGPTQVTPLPVWSTCAVSHLAVASLYSDTTAATLPRLPSQDSYSPGFLPCLSRLSVKSPLLHTSSTPASDYGLESQSSVGLTVARIVHLVSVCFTVLCLYWNTHTSVSPSIAQQKRGKPVPNLCTQFFLQKCVSNGLPDDWLKPPIMTPLAKVGIFIFMNLPKIPQKCFS